MGKNPYEKKVPRSWSIVDLDKEIDRLRRESRRLGDELETIVGKEGYGKATTTLDVQIEDIKFVVRRLTTYRDFWFKHKRRPTQSEVEVLSR